MYRVKCCMRRDWWAQSAIICMNVESFIITNRGRAAQEEGLLWKLYWVVGLKYMACYLLFVSSANTAQLGMVSWKEWVGIFTRFLWIRSVKAAGGPSCFWWVYCLVKMARDSFSLYCKVSKENTGSGTDSTRCLWVGAGGTLRNVWTFFLCYYPLLCIFSSRWSLDKSCWQSFSAGLRLPTDGDLEPPF